MFVAGCVKQVKSSRQFKADAAFSQLTTLMNLLRKAMIRGAKAVRWLYRLKIGLFEIVR